MVSEPFKSDSSLDPNGTGESAAHQQMVSDLYLNVRENVLKTEDDT